MSLKLSGLNPLAYQGVEPSQPPQMLVLRRAPTSSDSKNVNIGTFWLYIANDDVELWQLVDLAGGIAAWIRIYPQGGAGEVVQYQCNTDVAVPAGGEIELVGVSDGSNNTGATTVANPNLGNRIEINIEQIEYIADTGSASPANDQLSIVGNNVVETLAAMDAVTVSLTQGADGQVVIGATGMDPAWADITSSDNSVTITAGPNSLDLTVPATLQGSLILLQTQSVTVPVATVDFTSLDSYRSYYLYWDNVYTTAADAVGNDTKATLSVEFSNTGGAPYSDTYFTGNSLQSPSGSGFQFLTYFVASAGTTNIVPRGTGNVWINGNGTSYKTCYNHFWSAIYSGIPNSLGQTFGVYWGRNSDIAATPFDAIRFNCTRINGANTFAAGTFSVYGIRT